LVDEIIIAYKTPVIFLRIWTKLFTALF